MTKQPDLSDEIYDLLNGWFPGQDFSGCGSCQVLNGCKNIRCPNMKLAMSRKIATLAEKRLGKK